MRLIYFTLIPDYTQSCLLDGNGERINLETLRLPKDLLSALEVWHRAYRKIIPLSDSERLAKSLEIEVLDKQGIKLARSLEQLISRGAKVKYFSEGKSKLLN